MPRRFDQPPLPEYQFGVASVVPAEFLNQLDDMLYYLADSILPTHTGSQVLIQATAGDEAQVVIDRRYFTRASSIYEPVSGAPGTYDLYAVASYVPTSHATTVKSFEAVVATSPPNDFAYSRHLAKVIYDGTRITDVLQDPHKLNVAQLDGHISSRNPADGDVLPVASSGSHKIAKGFRPLFPGVDCELGEVIDYFHPLGYNFGAPPPGWAYCNGQVLGPGDQDLVPGGSFQMPSLNTGELIVGADPTKAHGTDSSAVDTAFGAPGVGGGKSSDFGGVGGEHTHTGPAHSHQYHHTHVTDTGLAVMPHYHNLEDHTHGFNHLTITHGAWSGWPPGGSPDHPGVDVTTAAQTAGARGAPKTNLVSPEVYAAAPSTDSPAYSSTPAAYGSAGDTTPHHQVLARIMKVRY